MQFLLVVVGIAFLFGLIQWARSGAVLWDIFRFSKHGLPSDAADAADTAETRKETLRKSIQRMEITMDELLRSSFKVLSILALGVWILVVASVVMDMLGLDWLDRLSFSTHRIMGNPTARASHNNSRSENSGRRNEALRSMGSGMRRQDGNRR